MERINIDYCLTCKQHFVELLLDRYYASSNAGTCIWWLLYGSMLAQVLL